MALRSQYSGCRRKASFIGLVPPANIIVNSSNITSSGLMVDRLGQVEEDRVLRSESLLEHRVEAIDDPAMSEVVVHDEQTHSDGSAGGCR